MAPAGDRQGSPAGRAPALDAAIAALHAAGVTEAALQQGEMAPEFELASVSGHWMNLEDLLRRGAAVVSFFRGAWCPYCNGALRRLQELLPALRAAGAEVAAISPQPPEIAQAQGERQGLAFALLHDAHNRVARLYGLVYPLPAAWIAHYRSLGIDIARLNGTERWELPLAATYVIGRDGIVAYASIEVDPARRFDAAAVLAAVARR